MGERLEKIYAILLIGALIFARLSVPVGHGFFALATICGIIALYRQRKSICLPPHWTSYAILWGIFLGFGLPSLFLMGHLGAGLKGLIYLYFYPSLSFFIMPLIIRRARYIYALFAAFFLVMAVDVMVSVYQVATLPPPPWGILQGEGFRGPILSLAGFILMSFATAVYVATSAAFPRWLRRVAQLSIFTSVIGLFTNRSRALWLLYPFALCAGFGKRFMVKVLIFVAAFAFMGISYTTVPVIHVRLDSAFNRTINESNLGRIYIWKSSMHMIEDHPWIGVGINQYQRALDEGGYRYAQEKQHLNQAHNNFLQVTAEEGFIGGLGFTIFLLGFLYVSWRSSLREGRPFIAMVGTLFALYLLAFGQIEHTILRVPGMRALWMLSGAFYTLYTLHIRQRRDDEIKQGIQ